MSGEWVRARVQIDGQTGCWVWTGARSAGYGSAVKGTLQGRAHRVVWQLLKGPITDRSIHLCHRCDNPPCVNPEHMFLGSAADNRGDFASKRLNQSNQSGYEFDLKLAAECFAEASGRLLKIAATKDGLSRTIYAERSAERCRSAWKILGAWGIRSLSEHRTQMELVQARRAAEKQAS